MCVRTSLWAVNIFRWKSEQSEKNLSPFFHFILPPSPINQLYTFSRLFLARFAFPPLLSGNSLRSHAPEYYVNEGKISYEFHVWDFPLSHLAPSAGNHLISMYTHPNIICDAKIWGLKSSSPQKYSCFQFTYRLAAHSRHNCSPAISILWWSSDFVNRMHWMTSPCWEEREERIE